MLEGFADDGAVWQHCEDNGYQWLGNDKFMPQTLATGVVLFLDHAMSSGEQWLNDDYRVFIRLVWAKYILLWISFLQNLLFQICMMSEAQYLNIMNAMQVIQESPSPHADRDGPCPKTIGGTDLAPQSRSTNTGNRFHSACSEANCKLPWPYEYPLALFSQSYSVILWQIKAPPIVRCPCFHTFTLLWGIFRNFPAKGFKILPIPCILSLLEMCPSVSSSIICIHGTCCQEFVSFLVHVLVVECLLYML